MSATPHVLFIDDDRSTVDTCALILRREGYEVQTANDAAVGLELVQASVPDAVVVDLRMPFVNGLGFLYRLRALPECRDLPVAVVTADYCLDDEVLDSLANLGARVYFKPLDINDLVTLTHILVSAGKPAVTDIVARS